MKDKLIRSTVGQTLEPAVFAGVNTSGCAPLNDFVLVLPDKAAEKVGSVYMPDSVKDNQQLASETGIVVALGVGAFAWSRDRMREHAGPKPNVGDRIVYQRYAGQQVVGIDGTEYRLMGDKEIAAVQTGLAPDAPAEDRDAKGGTVTTGAAI